MGIILGLSAALFWGSADFLARYATRIIGTYRTLFFMQFIGVVCLGIYLAATGEFAHLAARTGWQPWAWAILAALLNVVSALALYRSFEVGVLAIVSPIAASSAALTVTLAFLSGEMVSQARGIGIGAALAGVVLAALHFTPLPETKEVGASTTITAGVHKSRFFSIPTRQGRLTRGVGWALTASLGYGIHFWLLGFYITPALGGIMPVWIIRFMTICTLALFALPARQSIRLPRGRVWWLIAGIGILDTLAYLSAAIGFTTDQISVVSVLASLFSAVTVLLAWFFLHEKLQWSQWLGIAIIFAGVALVKL